MNYNTFIHTVAGVNEVLQKQAAAGTVGKAWNAIKGNPWISAPVAGAGLGLGAGALYGGLSDNGSIPLSMLAGGLGGAALGAGGVGAWKGLRSAPAMKYYGQSNPWYLNRYLTTGLGGAALGAGAGALYGGLSDNGSIPLSMLAGAGIGGGAGLGGAYGLNTLGKYRYLKGLGVPVNYRHVLNPFTRM